MRFKKELRMQTKREKKMQVVVEELNLIVYDSDTNTHNRKISRLSEFAKNYRESVRKAVETLKIQNEKNEKIIKEMMLKLKKARLDNLKDQEKYLHDQLECKLMSNAETKNLLAKWNAKLKNHDDLVEEEMEALKALEESKRCAGKVGRMKKNRLNRK
jgi:predicted RND superfamily exporter protein